jgi:hypothetical protein
MDDLNQLFESEYSCNSDWLLAELTFLKVPFCQPAYETLLMDKGHGASALARVN